MLKSNNIHEQLPLDMVELSRKWMFSFYNILWLIWNFSNSPCWCICSPFRDQRIRHRAWTTCTMGFSRRQTNTSEFVKFIFQSFWKIKTIWCLLLCYHWHFCITVLKVLWKKIFTFSNHICCIISHLIVLVKTVGSYMFH